METMLNDSPLYKNLFQKLAIPVLLLEIVGEEAEDYRIWEANDAACSLFHCKKDDLMVRDLTLLFGNAGTSVKKAISELLLTNDGFSSSLVLQINNDTRIRVDLNASIINEGDNKLIHLMLIEQKEPNKLLKENAYLKTVIDTVQSIVLIIDKEGNISSWNKYAEDLTGYKLHEVQNEKFWNLFIDNEEKNRIVENYISCKIPVDYENYWILKNGEKRYLKWKSIVMNDENGETSYIISTGMDITEQVNSFNELERSKEKYHALVSSMDDLVFTVDQSLTITSAYGKWMESNGYTKELFEGKSVAEIFPDAILQQQKCIKSLGGMSTEFEWEFNSKEKKHYFHSVLSPIKLKNKEVRDIVSVTRDITEKKMVEEQHKRIYEAVTSGIIVQNQAGKIVIANKNACMILGYSEHELMNMTSMSNEWGALDEFGEVLPGEEHPAMRTLRTGEPISNVEMAIYNPEKAERRWILVDSRPIFEAGSKWKVEYTLTTFHDITEKKETDLLLQQSEKLAVVGQLASGIAHEIRNPLTGIMGFLKLLDESPEKERLFDYLPIIKQELNQIHQITEEFIELSLPKNPVWKVVDVIKSIQSALSFLRSELETNEIQTCIVGQNTVNAKIWGVESQLKQLFIHLFKNANEAMPFRGKLSIKIDSAEDKLFIDVEDNGRGISPERVKHLGEPYYSIKEKGTGLGLMRCLKITHDHKGKISFTSRPGEGTVVRLEFDLY